MSLRVWFKKLHESLLLTPLHAVSLVKVNLFKQKGRETEVLEMGTEVRSLKPPVPHPPDT